MLTTKIGSPLQFLICFQVVLKVSKSQKYYSVHTRALSNILKRTQALKFLINKKHLLKSGFSIFPFFYLSKIHTRTFHQHNINNYCPQTEWMLIQAKIKESWCLVSPYILMCKGVLSADLLKTSITTFQNT